MLPDPFKTPLELFNAVSTVAVKNIDNKEKLRDAMNRLSARLVEVNSILIEVDNYDGAVIDSGNELAQVVVNQAALISKMQNLSPIRGIIQHEEIANQITTCLDNLKEATDRHHRIMTLAIDQAVSRISKTALALRLSLFAPSALFDADAENGGPGRHACALNTRVQLMDRLKQWAFDTSFDSSPIFWLGGMAGTGKSTIAYTLCQHLDKEERLGASFFCSRSHEQSRSRAYIIPTIVRQLLDVHNPFARFLDCVRIDRVISASPCHIHELLLEPWSKAMASQSTDKKPVVIVIDALDEIEGSNQGSQLIKQLIQAVATSGTMLRGLKFLVTSHPHPQIVEECNLIDRKAVYHLEEITPQKAFEDVQHFVEAELPDLSPQELQDIVASSGGLFIHAATIVRYLCPSNFTLSPMQKVERLNLLKTTGHGAMSSDGEHGLLIDSLYQVILAQSILHVGQEVKTLKRVLYAVVTTRRPLTVSALAPLVVDPVKQADELSVRNILHLFYAVLYVSPHDNCIYSFHKSFIDFILDPTSLP
ncbi:WD40 repeat-like protein [Mycena sanguinolenta]|uniref:WD40 repeat-like protein n=1 Tax=Mycena sanguinolenta TaxID=230812 RepID=A0A8H7DI58_9AGAR|nr:WD40 repeat-like protein [Mycena sanguinolenta]